MKKLFYLLIATIVLISCGNGSKNKTETSIAKENQTNRVEVLYFHGAQRCITCRAIEANTVALLSRQRAREARQARQRAREARQDRQRARRARQANRPLTKPDRTRIRPQDRVTASQRDSPKARQTSPQTSQQPHPQPRIPRRPPVKGRPRHLRKQNHHPRKGQRRQPPAPARMPHPRPFQRLIIAFIRWKRERHYMVSVLSCIMT